MTLVKLPVVNVGTDAEPHYKVNYPAYVMVEIDYAAMVAIVDVDPRTLPRDFVPLVADVSLANGDLRRPIVPTGPVGVAKLSDPHVHRGVVVNASQEETDAWHAHLDAMYQEHAGKFRPLA